MEINTLPGLNPLLSDLCIESISEGMPYADLINEILMLAAGRWGLAGKLASTKKWASVFVTVERAGDLAQVPLMAG